MSLDVVALIFVLRFAELIGIRLCSSGCRCFTLWFLLSIDAECIFLHFHTLHLRSGLTQIKTMQMDDCSYVSREDK